MNLPASFFRSFEGCFAGLKGTRYWPEKEGHQAFKNFEARREFGMMSLLQNGLSLLVISLGLLIPLSCSRGKTTRETGEKKAVKETVINLPPGAMPLSAVLRTLETTGYAPVVEVEFEKDHWEIKAYQNGQLLQLKVGLVRGDIQPNPPPTFEKPLSVTVKALEDQGYGPILDVEHGRKGSNGTNSWEIEAYKGNSEVSVSVEPASGKVTAK
jgi:hypothetical protein